uniref:Uncharacterized protein n=1 Tax=Vespula pensylvanica TaxID=30213 RepID=A0A834PFP3_VESPE|nr:hypothetical protein H0235_001245 [Vespula pensylvanica]
MSSFQHQWRALDDSRSRGLFLFNANCLVSNEKTPNTLQILYFEDPMLVSTPVRSGAVGEKNEGATESNLYSYAGFTFRFRRLYCAIYRAKGGSHVVGFSNSAEVVGSLLSQNTCERTQSLYITSLSKFSEEPIGCQTTLLSAARES